MKLFTNKKVMQKMTIVLVFLILFNFITPTYSKAESSFESAGKVIFVPVRGLLMIIGDATMNLLQYFFVTNEKAVIPASDQVTDAENYTGHDNDFHGNVWFNDKNPLVEKVFGELAEDLDGYWEDKPNFKYTPQRIFEGSVKFFSIDFINGKKTDEVNENGSGSTSGTDIPDKDIEDMTWYKSYESIVNKLFDEYISTKSAGNDDKANNIAHCLKKLGVDISNLANISDSEIKARMPSTSQARDAIKKLSYQYNNGSDTYDLFDAGAKEDLTDRKSVVKELLLGKIEGILGNYHLEIGDDQTMGEELDYDITPINVMHDLIATWYKILRNIALVAMLSVLVYIGIRIILSSTAADQAKYKAMLTDWVVALCLLFALHYIMAFITGGISLFTQAFSKGTYEANWTDDIFTTVRLMVQSESLSNQVGYTILYLVLVIYTIIFTFYYLKRVVYAAFLTMIAPLVAMTYPLDKIKDGQAQAFNMWLKEYIANAIVQPIHLLIYTTLISTVMALAEQNLLYAIVVMGAMIPSEKFIREMFGLNNPKTGSAGGFAGGMLAANAFNKLLRKPPKFPPFAKPNGKGGAGNADSDSEENTKIKYSNNNTKDLFSSASKSINPNSTEGKQDIDESVPNGFQRAQGTRPIRTAAYSASSNNDKNSYRFPEIDQGTFDMASMGNGVETPFKFIDDTNFKSNANVDNTSEQSGWSDISDEQFDNGNSIDIPEETTNMSKYEQKAREANEDFDKIEISDDVRSSWHPKAKDMSQYEQKAREANEDFDNIEIPDDVRNSWKNSTSDNDSDLQENGSNSDGFDLYKFMNLSNTKGRNNNRQNSEQEQGEKIQTSSPIQSSERNQGSSSAMKSNPSTQQPLSNKEKTKFQLPGSNWRHAVKTAMRRQQIKGHKQTIQSVKQLGKGAAKFTLKTAGGTILGAAGAMMGLAGAIATGDPSNIWKMAGAGVAAGAAGGSALGESAYNMGEGIVGGTIDSVKDVRKEYQNIRAKDKEYQRKIARREARSHDKRQMNNAEVRKNYSGGKDILSHFGASFYGEDIEVLGTQIPILKDINFNVGTPSAKELRGMTRTIQKYQEEGYTDDPKVAMNCYNLENGKDSKGNEIPKELYGREYSHTENLMAAKYAKFFNPDDDATWTTTRDKLKREMDRTLETEYNITDRKERNKKSEEFANKQMLKVSMAKGMSYDDAKELQERKLGDEASAKSKKLNDYKKQAKIQDAVNRGDEKALDSLLNE